jgi:tetratricopeptide (TPR) repeat protein
MNTSPGANALTDPRARTWLAAALLAGAAVLAYANTFQVPFLFDDIPSIVENPTILRLWPPGQALSPPSEGGVTVSGRPILNLSLAINHAISGLDLWSYHALNLLIHVLAGLTLFGVARRTLRTLRHDDPEPLALVIAGLWLLHPLQTESVTYLIQRAESLAGLFFLLTLYAFSRSVDSPRPRLWSTLSFLSCLLCAGTKEIAALAPVMVFLYDRTFISGSFRGAWRMNRWRHLALAATWIPLAWLIFTTGGNRGGTIGFDVDVSITGYWLTQFEAVARYLWLSFWPSPLVFDYGKIAAPSLAEALRWSAPVLVLVPATLWALWRRPVAGFLGAWFFGILAPTSIVPGELQMIVEHRMYLPLAAVIAFVVGVAAPRIGRRTMLTAGAALALAAGVVTWQRNVVYQDEERLWEDTRAKRPDNARTHNNIGRYFYMNNRLDEAIERYTESLRLDPDMWVTHLNLGLALMRAGRPAEAIAPFETAVRIGPHYFKVHLNLGIALTKAGRAADAIPHFATALRTDPWPMDVHFHWGNALSQLERWAEACAHYEACLRFNEKHVEALTNWGSALVALGATQEAIARFEAALAIEPDLPEVHFNLGLAQAGAGRQADAIRHYTEAVRLKPDYATAHLNLGIALAQDGSLAEAIDHLQEAARLQPGSADAHTNLGVALALAGRGDDALAAYRTALELRPGDAQTHYNVGFALLEAGRWAEARPHFEAALRIRPDFPEAREILRRLDESRPR